MSAFELMSKMGFDFLSETMPDVRQVVEDKPEWIVLIELGMGGAQSASDALERLFELGHEAGLVSDGVIAQSTQQAQDIWTIRETIPEANRRIGSISSHDISLPLSMIPEFIKVAPNHLETLCDMRINCFGHLGDGNLHYNVFHPKDGIRKSSGAYGMRSNAQCMIWSSRWGDRTVRNMGLAALRWMIWNAIAILRNCPHFMRLRARLIPKISKSWICIASVIRRYHVGAQRALGYGCVRDVWGRW